jgi:flagellar hook-associated protein 3 FlgL
MAFRVTAGQIFRSQIEQMRFRAEENMAAQRTAATGRRITYPSDDPVGVQRLALLDAAKKDVELSRYKSDQATDELLLMDQALGNMQDGLSRLREIAMQMSTGTMDQSARLNAVTEVNMIKDTLIYLGNSRFGDKRLFAGQQLDQDPFDPAGVYSGNSTPMTVTISGAATVQTTLAGDALLRGALGGPDILQEVDNLATALGTNLVTGIQSAIQAMDDSHDHINNERSLVGARMRVTVSFEAHLADMDVTLAGEVSDLEDADMMYAFSNLVRTQQAYETALQASIASRTPTIFQLL